MSDANTLTWLHLIDKETVQCEKEPKRLKSAVLYSFFAFDLEQIKRATEMKAPFKKCRRQPVELL